MNVSVIYDPGCLDGTRGGAELAMDELIDLAPERVTITSPADAETVVIGNCVKADPETLIPNLEGKDVWRFHHDLARDEPLLLREWLKDNARHIFTSPLHRELYGWEHESELIPPCPKLADFKPNRQTRRHGKRKGTVAVGSWQSQSKGGRLVADLGEPLDCYGPGAFPPRGPHINYVGTVNPPDLPALLWQYERFVFLPIAPEPFGRCVAEAWAAGCEVVTNDLVGARWWIENEPDRLFTAAEDFWEYVRRG